MLTDNRVVLAPVEIQRNNAVDSGRVDVVEMVHSKPWSGVNSLSGADFDSAD